jgi:hypothetical protein
VSLKMSLITQAELGLVVKEAMLQPKKMDLQKVVLEVAVGHGVQEEMAELLMLKALLLLLVVREEKPPNLIGVGKAAGALPKFMAFQIDNCRMVHGYGIMVVVAMELLQLKTLKNKLIHLPTRPFKSFEHVSSSILAGLEISQPYLFLFIISD